jgi:hypothetical protein
MPLDVGLYAAQRDFMQRRGTLCSAEGLHAAQRDFMQRRGTLSYKHFMRRGSEGIRILPLDLADTFTIL